MKRFISAILTIAIIIALIPAMPATAAAPGTYNPGDIAIINAIITNNDLDWPLAPADGSSIPAEWESGNLDFSVWWWYPGVDATDQRVWHLYVSDSMIKTLDISGLTELATLDCSGNRLTSLDVTKNTKLENLECESNDLETLDVSKNTILESLNISQNRLTTLDVSNNAKLKGLSCRLNDLTALDVSKNTALEGLICGGNLFTNVNIKNNPHLTNFNIDDGDRARLEHNLAVRAAKRSDQVALDHYRGRDAKDRYKQDEYGSSYYTIPFDDEDVVLANTIVEGLTNDYEKALAIYTWVAENIWYNHDTSIFQAISGQTHKGVLRNKRAICSGYATLTVALLRAAGIPAKYISGDAGGAHAWTEAFADGRWIIMDTTWGSNNDYSDGEYAPQLLSSREWFDVSIRHLSATHRYDDHYSENHLPPPPLAPIDTASSWARKGIKAAINKGFAPDEIQGYYKNVITRAEFCRMAVKWVEYALGKDINTIVAEQGISKRMKHKFSDTKDPAILAAYRLGITTGSVTPTSDKPGKFNPNGKFTRQEAATMIMKTCKVVGMDVSNVKDAKFKDISKASKWAVDAINFVSNNGIMSGTGNNNFDPKATFTREQSITTFNNIKYK